MAHDPRSSPRANLRLTPGVDPLERRALLSGTAPGHQDVSIQVPSAYFSQQSSQLDVTLVRTTTSGRSYAKGPLTVSFSAAYGPADNVSPSAVGAGQQFTPVNESVTFPAGQATETVAVPVDSGAANPGLVPVQLVAASSARQVKGSSATVYLAKNSDAIPPSIVGVQRVAGGIAITFSKAMDPATVANIHNYAVKFSPSQNFSLAA